MSSTLLDEIRKSMAERLREMDGEEPPVALLWTDPDGQWQPLIPALMKVLPELYALGTYAPGERKGPVIWLKCVVDRTLADVAPQEGKIPIIYLPYIGRQMLRAADDCDALLQPLVELQFRGAVWHHSNGNDWTVAAFLSSDDAIGLDMARGAPTREAALRVLPLLAMEPIAALRGRRLEAEDFNRLAIGDSVGDLLTWMSDAETFREACEPTHWKSFCEICARDFGFDPEDEGLRPAADALAAGGGKWNDVWERFSSAPLVYPGIPAVLRIASPKDLLNPIDPSRQPILNQEREDGVRMALEEAAELPHAEACDKVAALDDEHGERRDWVWAKIDKSPFALALAPLGRLAREARRDLANSSVDAFIADYTERGWCCDWAAIEALSLSVTGIEFEVVAKAVHALYEPWLDRAARRFQELLSAGNVDLGKLASGVNAEPGTCILFADGLRFDLGAMLGKRLEARGVRVKLAHRVTPVPTVTATAKPLASPAHPNCTGAATAEDFCPEISDEGKPATAARLRALMAKQDILIEDKGKTLMALDDRVGGWVETGEIDHLGHSLGVKLPRQLKVEIEQLANQVDALFDAGWSKVRVVTDHGWLLLKGGLPKVELPPALVETKWARCAAVKGGSTPAVPTYPWYWNPLLRIASPPGIGSFFASTEYAHGGISPQECVVPDLIAERDTTAVTARITKVDWRGMRCRVTVETNTPHVVVDLWLNRKQSGSSIAASVREVNDSGNASLVVAEDKYEGAAALVVVLDKAGRVLDDQSTTVGDGA